MDALLNQATKYMQQLSVALPSRSTGSDGNRQATRLFAEAAASFDWAVETPGFQCINWELEGIELSAGGAVFSAHASPYTLSCEVLAPLAVVSTLSELESADLTSQVVLLRGELTREQLMPKNFPYYNPEAHQHIIALLEGKQPGAIVAATTRDPEMVGAQYPFPLIEDGDFTIPAAYMTAEEGEALAAHVGQPVTLRIQARRIDATGCNVIARKGPADGPHVVVFAHIDAHLGSPGASDDASGVAVLLLLAELLADYRGVLGLELVAMNGEDYYCCPGEQLYVAANAAQADRIALGINIDDAGYIRGDMAYSLYDCLAPLAETVKTVLGHRPGWVEGEPWYQGDHGLFLMWQRPALAITSALMPEMMAEYTHSVRDTVEIVDPAKLVDIALALQELVLALARQVGSDSATAA